MLLWMVLLQKIGLRVAELSTRDEQVVCII